MASTTETTTTIKTPKPQILSGEHQALLQSVLDQIEKESGSMYQITVHKFGKYADKQIVVGDFTKRENPIEVYDMKPGYEELNGTYPNRLAVETRIKELQLLDLFDGEYPKIESDRRTCLNANCKACGSRHDIQLIGGPTSHRISYMCEKMKGRSGSCIESRWSDIALITHMGMVSKLSASRFADIGEYGKYRYI